MINAFIFSLQSLKSGKMGVLSFMLVSFLGTLPIAAAVPPSWNCTVNMGVILDASPSFTEEQFKKMKEFIMDLARSIDLESGASRFGLITNDNQYAKLELAFDLSRGGKQELSYIGQKLDGVEQTSKFSLYRVLRKADSDLFTWKVTKDGRDKVLIILSNGGYKSKVYEYKPYVKALEKKGVKILAVGIGLPNKPIQKEDFLPILSNNEKRLFEVNDLKELPSLLPTIMRESCKESKTSTTRLSSCKLDLGLVVDTTQSIKQKNINELKTVLKKLVQQFDISNDGAHIALETFGDKSVIHNLFDEPKFFEKNSLTNLIDEKIDKLTKPTRLDLALEKADLELFTRENGDRHGVRSVMVLFTDGRSHPKETEKKKYKEHLRSIKSKGVRVVVLAIGPDAQKPSYQKVLKELGGENVLSAHDYGSLVGALSDVVNIICPPNPCEAQGMDLAFAIDRTRSVGIDNYKLVKGFLLQLTDALTIGPEETHTGLIVFAKQAHVISTFADSGFYDKENLYHLIYNLSGEKGSFGLRLFIDRALKKANEELFTDRGGDRPEFPNVLILLSAGKTNPESKSFSATIPLLQKKGVKIIAIGVGNYEEFEGQLEEIAGEDVYTVNSFKQLSDLFAGILEATCSQPQVNRRLFKLRRDWHRNILT